MTTTPDLMNIETMNPEITVTIDSKTTAIISEIIKIETIIQETMNSGITIKIITTITIEIEIKIIIITVTTKKNPKTNASKQKKENAKI